MSMSTFGVSFYSLKCWLACVNLLVRPLLLCLRLGVVVLSVLALQSQYSELDCEENFKYKLEVRLFD